MSRLLVDIFLFLKTGDVSKDDLKLTKLNILFKVFLLDLILGILFAFIVAFFLPNIIGLETGQNSDNKVVDNTLIHVFVVLILAPFWEEVSFRLYLRFTPLNLALSFSCIVYFILSLATRSEYISIPNQDTFFIILTCGIAFIVSYFMFRMRKELIFQFYKSHFRLIVLFSIISFAYLHLTNYPINITVIILSPILLIPQLISGVLYSYTRLKLGFLFAIILHIISNLLFNIHLLEVLVV